MQTLQEMTFAFPTIRQGAGEVSFPVDIFLVFSRALQEQHTPVLSVLAGFQPLVHHVSVWLSNDHIVPVLALHRSAHTVTVWL